MRLTALAVLEGKRVGWFSPTYKMLAEVWRELKNALGPAASRVSEQEHRLEMPNGGIVDMWSLDSPDTARGRKYHRVIVDEAAQVAGLADAWQQVIRPTLTDYAGDAWFFSTPRGLNFFHALYQRGQDPAQTDWASWRAPTIENPYISPAEIEAAKRDSPEQTSAQEFDAQFLADGTSVFRHVEAASTGRWHDRAESGRAYIVGCDWGQTADFTVFSVLDVTLLPFEQVHLERSNQVDYLVQSARLQILSEKFRPQLIVAESNSIGRVVIELLRQRNLPVWSYETTNATKAAAVQALQLAFDERWLRILEDPTQKGELMAFTSERLPSGMLRYGAPEGMHDDTVIALALAWVGACAGEQRPIARSFAVEA